MSSGPPPTLPSFGACDSSWRIQSSVRGALGLRGEWQGNRAWSSNCHRCQDIPKWTKFTTCIDQWKFFAGYAHWSAWGSYKAQRCSQTQPFPWPTTYPATFQREQVPKRTHMSQAVSQQHFAEGLETASMECKRTKSTKVDRPGGLHHAKNFEASGFCYVTRTTSKKTRAQQQATINKRGDALRSLKMPEPYLSTDVRQARRSGMSTSRLSQC